MELVERWLEFKTGRDVIDGEIVPGSHPIELLLGGPGLSGLHSKHSARTLKRSRFRLRELCQQAVLRVIGVYSLS